MFCPTASLEWPKSVTPMGPSPAMWAPTWRTRQSKTLSTGSNLDKSEESRLSLLCSPPLPPHPPPAAPDALSSCLHLIPPWQGREKNLESERANQLLPVPPFPLLFLCSVFSMIFVFRAKINHLNFSLCWFICSHTAWWLTVWGHDFQRKKRTPVQKMNQSKSNRSNQNKKRCW